MSARLKERGLLTRPSIFKAQPSAAMAGRVVVDGEELVVRGDPGVEPLPDELGADDIGGGVGGGLVEPGEDLVAGLAGEGEGRLGEAAGERRHAERRPGPERVAPADVNRCPRVMHHDKTS